MRILFLMKVFEIGGIEVVTSILANKLIEEGHEVHVASFISPNVEMAKRLNKSIQIHSLKGYKCNQENIVTLHNILSNNKIEIIINQWGLPFLPVKVIRKALKGLDCKILSAYHNDPKANAKILHYSIKKKESNNCIAKGYYSILEFLSTKITGLSMRYVYQNSDYFIILSKSFIKNFSTFTKISDLSKLKIITNPVTISNKNFTYDSQKKKKEIIYVGRIDYNQKRVIRILEIWRRINKQYPDWHLKIIGDGPEKVELEHFSKIKALTNVSFEGFQDPTKYYETASIILLTSEYEGFGLVIVEAMSFGTIPVVYGSYNAIYDIVDHKKDGYIIKPQNNEFPIEDMTNAIANLIENENERIAIAQEAIIKAKNFSLDKIYKKWNNLFIEVNKSVSSNQ